jgi:NAD dependent epimerase/dehydratase family enzyme
VPAFVLRVALGEFAEVLLASQRVVPRVALGSGFVFKYPEIHGALAAVVGH